MTDADSIEMKVSPFRRWFAAGTVALTGVIFLGMALQNPPNGALLQLMIWALAALLLASALKLWRDTEVGVRLVGTRLETCAGELIVAMEDVEAIERGHFAFRPSNGFSLSLKRKAALRWRMGLWWTAGKRAAFGGAASSVEAKRLAEAIEHRLGLHELPNA